MNRKVGNRSRRAATAGYSRPSCPTMGRRPRRSPPRLWDDEVQSALAEVEALYNFSPLGLCVLDRDLRYRRINRRLAELNGLPSADHLGRTVKDVFPQFAEQAGAWARRVFRTGKPVFNVEVAGETPAQPGKRRFWREHWLPLRDRRRRIVGVAVIIEEVTAQKRAEAALREREGMFHALTDGLTELLTTVNAEGRVLYESPNMTRVLGYRTGELMGRRMFDLVHPDDLSRAQIVFRKLLADPGGALRVEVRVRAKGGGWFWLDTLGTNLLDNPHVRGVVLNSRDVTDRNRAEEMARLSANEWRVTFDAVADAIFLLDADQRIRRCNRAARALFAREDERIVGHRCWEVVHARRRPLPECPLRRMRTSLQRESMDLAIGDRWYRVTVDPLLNEAGVLTGAVHIVSDITVRKQAEAALENLNRDLERRVEERTKALRESERRFQALATELEARNRQLLAMGARLSKAQEDERRRIAQGLHDEVGQLLVACHLKLGTLRKVATEREASTAIAEADRLLGMAGDEIRELAFELSSPALYEVGFEAAVEELCDHMEKTFGVRFEIKCDGERWRMADGLKAPLYHAVRELLLNVVKHAGVNCARVCLGQKEGRLRIAVEDDGKGFDASAPGHGAVASGGFGLYSIRERLRSLGGTLHVGAAPGKGTRAVIEAPL